MSRGQWIVQMFQLRMKPRTASISVKAGSTLQNPNMYQNQSHGHDSNIKYERQIAAEKWANIAKRAGSRTNIDKKLIEDY